MQQEDYILREIQKFSQFLQLLIAKVSRTQSNEGVNVLLEVEQALKDDPRTSALLAPQASQEQLAKALSEAALDRNNREHLADLLIQMAASNPEHAQQYFDRARFLLEQPSDTISLRQTQLLAKIP